MKPNKLRTIALLVTASTLLGVGTANAVTQSVSANVKFFTAITIDTLVNINFGNVIAGVGGTYAIGTASNTVTPSAGGVLEGGVPVVGSIKIHGSAAQTINISAGLEVANNGVSITAASEVCKYGAGADNLSCTMNGAAAPTAAGTVLKLGATIVADGTQADNTTAAPSFTVTVLYP